MFIQRRWLLRVTLPSLVISIALGVVCWLGIRSLNRLQVDRLRLTSNEIAQLIATQEAQLRLRQIRVHALLFAMDPSASRREILQSDHRQFEEAFAKSKNAADTEEEKRILDELNDSYQKYRVEIEAASSQFQNNSKLGDFLNWADAHPVGPLLTMADEAIRLNQRSISEINAENDLMTTETRRTMVLLGITGPLAGLFGGIGVAWGVSRSFTQLRLMIKDTNDQLEREIGSVRVLAVGDHHHHLDRQMELVSDRVKTIVEQLQKQRREITRAEQLAAVGQLAAGVAHEIRNPLTGVKILIEAALLPNGSHRLTQDEMRMMLSQIRRVERTVQGLLECSRPTKSDRQIADLSSLARQAIEQIRPHAIERGIELKLDSPVEKIPVSVDMDLSLSLIGNLLMNAIEASPPQASVHVEVGLPIDGHVSLCVSDQGSGIDAALSEKLFAPFVTGKRSGTGLGLFIAKRIAEDHGGSLIGNNQPNGGAKFTVTLPVMELENA